MIPIRDATPSKNYPVVTHVLIAVNVIVFLYQLSQGAAADRFVYFHGLVPARYSVPDISAYFSLPHQAFSLVSFMFLHGGFWHLLGNMWSLYIFGDNVEDRLGPLRYAAFYLLCGICSGLTHMLTNFHSNVPTIGASGAIAGVMGAYFILHPTSRILTLIPIFFIPYFVEIPAFFFLGLWFVLQFINAAASHGNVTGIAWWAHIGGFVFGIVFLKLFDAMPTTGVTERLRPATTKKSSPRLQTIQTGGAAESADLYGVLNISPLESVRGAQKRVNIPWGFYKRMFKVTIPPGIQNGTILRLRGLGKLTPEGGRGDLLLTVEIQPG